MVLSQTIDIGDVYVIITIISAKQVFANQVYNGKVKLFKEIELHIPFASPFSIPFHSSFLVLSSISILIQAYRQLGAPSGVYGTSIAASSINIAQ